MQGTATLRGRSPELAPRPGAYTMGRAGHAGLPGEALEAGQV